MFKNIDVIFFIEHKDRELASIQLVTKKLNKKGITTLILPVHFGTFYLFVYKPKIIVNYGIFFDSQLPLNISRNLFDNVLYVSMNWEQLLSPINLEFKKPRGEYTLNQVFHIAWDEVFKNYLISSGVNSNNISVTGNILHEVLFTQIQQKNVDIVNEYNINQYEKVIFSPMNLAWAFLREGQLEYRLNLGYDKQTLYEHHDLAKRYLEILSSWITDAAKNLPNYLFILRPHPNVCIEDYYSFYNNKKLVIPNNLKISKQHTISEWLSVADVVCSNWSTVVYDANRIGINAALLSPIKRPPWLNVPWNDNVTNIKSYEEFLTFLSDTSNEKKSTSSLIRNSESENVASYIEKLLEGQIKRPTVALKGDANFKDFKNILKQLLRFISCKFLHCKFVGKGLKYDFFDKI